MQILHIILVSKPSFHFPTSFRRQNVLDKMFSSLHIVIMPTHWPHPPVPTFCFSLRSSLPHLQSHKWKPNPRRSPRRRQSRNQSQLPLLGLQRLNLPSCSLTNRRPIIPQQWVVIERERTLKIEFFVSSACHFPWPSWWGAQEEGGGEGLKFRKPSSTWLRFWAPCSQPSYIFSGTAFTYTSSTFSSIVSNRSFP